jgi:hypothetical protein
MKSARSLRNEETIIMRKLSLLLLLTSVAWACKPKSSDPGASGQSIGSKRDRTARLAFASVKTDAEWGWCYFVEDPSFQPVVIRDQNQTGEYILRQYNSSHPYALKKGAAYGLFSDGSAIQEAARKSLIEEVMDLSVNTGMVGTTLGLLCDTLNSTDRIFSRLEKIFSGSASSGRQTGDKSVQCQGSQASIRTRPTALLDDSSYQWLTGKLRAMTTSDKDKVRTLRCPSFVQEYEMSSSRP